MLTCGRSPGVCLVTVLGSLSVQGGINLVLDVLLELNLVSELDLVSFEAVDLDLGLGDVVGPLILLLLLVGDGGNLLTNGGGERGDVGISSCLVLVEGGLGSLLGLSLSLELLEGVTKIFSGDKGGDG